MTMKPTFDYCAFVYLNQWQEHERALHEALTEKPEEDIIRRALTYFKIARSFPKLGEKASVLSSSLIKARDCQSLLKPCAKVGALAQSFKTDFYNYNISAASKLLWLYFREPFIIYDTRALRALVHFFKNDRKNISPYAEYCTAWRIAYEGHEREIEEAVERLPSGRIFMRSCPLNDEDLNKMVKEVWFKERVFDIYLWDLGRKWGKLRA